MADLFRHIKTRFVSVHPDFHIKPEGPEWQEVPKGYQIPNFLKDVWSPVGGKFAGQTFVRNIYYNKENLKKGMLFN